MEKQKDKGIVVAILQTVKGRKEGRKDGIQVSINGFVSSGCIK